jgi:transposase
MFFSALAREGNSKAVRTIAKECCIAESTARKWRQQYLDMGEEAKRHTRARSKVLGRNSRVTKSTCKMLVSPSRNPVRKQSLDAQIEYHKIPVQKRQLQRKLKEHTKKGGRYLCAFIKKVITAKNHEDRMVYGNEHLYDEMFGFWDHIVFTDEAHIDPTSQTQGRVLREQGTRDRPENIEERLPLKGVRFHIAAWISWWGKAEKLRFYNDEEDKVEQPPMPPKPRRRPTTETEEEYHRRLAEWEASKPHPRDVKVQGNSMTQKYYVENLLPVYVDAIEKMREIDSKPWFLQEDGDPSHGIRKAGLAQEYKDAYNIKNLRHPAQSPDLNPIEGIWAIIKQRLRKRIFDTEDEMKQALQEEWDKITMEEIRHRIADMPRRCAELVRSKGGPIRGNKW